MVDEQTGHGTGWRGRGRFPLSQVAATVTESAVTMLRVAAVTGLALAVVDYVIVRKQMMKQIQDEPRYEIKQEYKQRG